VIIPSQTLSEALVIALGADQFLLGAVEMHASLSAQRKAQVARQDPKQVLTHCLRMGDVEVHPGQLQMAGVEETPHRVVLPGDQQRMPEEFRVVGQFLKVVRAKREGAVLADLDLDQKRAGLVERGQHIRDLIGLAGRRGRLELVELVDEPGLTQPAAHHAKFVFGRQPSI
jgi:hypothetical protein